MRKAYFYMHLAIFLWGFTGIFGKAINLSEGMIVWYRMIISAAGLLPIILKNRQQLPGPGALLRISGIGLLVTIHWLLFYGAIKASNVSIALSCFSSISLFTAVLEPLFKREWPRISELLLGIAVIFGLYLIFSVDEVHFTGIVLAVASAFMGALFTVLNKTLTEKHSAVDITFYELLSGFILLTILLPVYFGISGTSFEVPGTMDWVYLLLLGLVCTSYAFTISMIALKKLDAFTLNLSVNLEPLYSIVLAVIIFKEYDVMKGGFVAGTAVILGSVVFHTWYRLRKSAVKAG